MKINKILFGLVIFFATLSQGWGADACTTPLGNKISLTSSGYITNKSLDGGATEQYLFTTTVPGVAKVSINGSDKKIRFNASLTSCPTTYQSNDITISLTQSDKDFNVVVYNKASRSKNYTLTVTFTPAPTLSISDAVVTEGNSGTTNAAFSVTLSKAPTSNVKVNYQTRDESISGGSDFALAGSDYEAVEASANASITFTPTGPLSQNITVKVYDDTKPEHNEKFFVDIIADPNSVVTISDNEAEGTIIDDDGISSNYECRFYPFNSPLGSDWQTGGTFTPFVEAGRLKLMKDEYAQNSFITQTDFLPPAKNRAVTVEFDFFAENGTPTPADGIAVVLSNADITPAAGGAGGAMGYRPGSVNSIPQEGFKGGWLGMAIDEYGNFSTLEKERRLYSIALRGSGDGFVGYDYLMGTSANIFGTNGLSSKRYRLKIDGLDQNKTLISLEVNKNDGNGYSIVNMERKDGNPVIGGVLDLSTVSGQAPLPNYFAVSFTAATGGLKRSYFIDNLEICSVSYPEDESDLVIHDFSASPASAFIGDEITLNLTVKNYGPADTSGQIQVTGLPNSSEWDIVSSPTGYDPASGTWTISDNMVRNSERTLTLKIKAKTAGTKTITAVANYANEADYTDNSKSITVEIINNAKFNAWETTLTKDTAKIYTKVVGQSFGLTVGTVDGTNFDGTLCAAVINNSGVALGGGGYQCKDTNATSNSFAWSITQAEKVAMINIKSKNTIKTGGAVPANFTGYTDSNSSDSFAIRPESFTVSPASITADENIKLSLTASSASGFDGDTHINTRLANMALTCSKTTGFLENEPYAFTFTNGVSGEVTISKILDIGDIKLYDSSWTSVDSNGDCVASSGSNVLIGGKYGCDIEGALTITPYAFLTTIDDVTPSGKWQYISPPSEEQNITIKASVKSQNKSSETLSNFDTSCAATDVAGKMSYTPTAVTGLQYKVKDGGFTDLTGTDISFNYEKEGFDRGEYKNLNITLRAKDREYDKTQEPIKLNNTELNTTSVAVNNGANVGTLTFLYGKIAAPNAMLDYAPTATVRAYAQVYATSSASLPDSNWVNAPGSSVWWINKLDLANQLSGANAIQPRGSSTLTNITPANTFNGITASLLNMNNGIANVQLDMSGAINKDQKIVLHFDVPSYLWYGAQDYAFGAGTNCGQHPCSNVEIFGTDSREWYGVGDKKGDKAIQTVPKGKRAPKINW